MGKDSAANGSKGICILYLTIGSGHQIAAEALQDAIKRQSPQKHVHAIDPLTETIELLPAMLETLQAASIILTPGWTDRVWRRGNPPALTDWMLEIGVLQKPIEEMLLEMNSEIVVATHVLPCVLSAALKERIGKPKRVFGVVTDWGVHRFWPSAGMDGYFVAHEDIRRTLIFRGVDPALIHVTGIPIRLGFERSQARVEMDPEDELRVLIMAGGLQTGAYVGLAQNLISLLDAIEDLGKEKLHLTIVTGKSRSLRRRLNRRAKKRGLKADVLGMVDDIHLLMSEHDILITKPGGLVVSEGLASGICLILFRPGPGQEEANVDFLARHGSALCGETPEDVVKALRRCIEDPSLVARLKKQAKALGHPSSASHVADHVLRMMESDNAPASS
jgi:processive 1,2-diacylglycerol beta-glucosyltransferase